MLLILPCCGLRLIANTVRCEALSGQNFLRIIGLRFEQVLIHHLGWRSHHSDVLTSSTGDPNRFSLKCPVHVCTPENFQNFATRHLAVAESCFWLTTESASHHGYPKFARML